MALKSTVLAPPPAPSAPRATTVLRAGPPPKRGTLDLVIGLVGLLLLFATVGMAVALPHKDVLPQQFKVAYLDTTTELATQTFEFKAGTADSAHTFAYDVPLDDVYLVTVKYEFKDDVAASAPDQFSLQLYDPAGNPVGPVSHILSPPGQDDTQNQTLPTYKAQLVSGQFSVTNPKPSDDIIETPDQSLTAPRLTTDLEKKAHLSTQGTWNLKVTLEAAGGCEPPQGPGDAQRFAACQQELLQMSQDGTASQQDAAQGHDPGNKFSVDVLSLTSFTPDVQKIG